MKKLLIFVMLTGFLAVNAQHASKDLNVNSQYFNLANNVKSDIIAVDGWNIPKTILPPEAYREIITMNRYDNKSEIIPVDGWNLSKTIVMTEGLRSIGTMVRYNNKSDIIPIDGWNIPKTIVQTVDR